MLVALALTRTCGLFCSQVGNPNNNLCICGGGGGGGGGYVPTFRNVLMLWVSEVSLGLLGLDPYCNLGI